MEEVEVERRLKSELELDLYSELAWYVPAACIHLHQHELNFGVSQAAQHSQGIQTLLEAEKEAAKIVLQARQCVWLSSFQT